MTSRHASRGAVAVLAAAIPWVASGQSVHGAVLERTSRVPVPGAVVLALDSAGVTVARTLTGARGTYEFAAPGATTIQTIRIGFRPAGGPT